LVFSAAGSGVLLVLVELVVVADAVAEVEAEVTAASVAPLEGARVTPGAVELLPQPATAAVTANRAHVSVIGLRMEVPEGSERG
jgi:uncharacterized protein (DUF169 family)